MLILSFQVCCFFFLNLVFGSDLVVTLFTFKVVLNIIYLYLFLDSIFLSVSVFIYSCSSSGSSSFSSAPDAVDNSVVAVSAVGVSANVSWSPFVAVTLT